LQTRAERYWKHSRESYNWVNQSLQGILETQEIVAVNAISMKGRKYVETMRLQESCRPFLSVSGYVGLAPKFMEQGDVPVLFCATKFPYVLRGNGDGTYMFVGKVYVHGIIDGKFVKIVRETEKVVLK
jgi:hypothetical protein